MKRFICQLFVLTSLVFMAASCQKAPFLTLNTPRSFTFTRDGGTQSITFTCNRDWSVSSSESWIQVSPSSGTASDGEVTVKITCAANTTYDPRSATVTIKVEELTEAVSISQDTGIGLIVSPKTLELTNAKQTIEIEVQKNVQYSIAIDNESAEWIKQGGTKALTTDKVTFTIEANTSYDNREGKITFKQLDGNLSETVVVRQSQTNGLFITTPDYSLSNEAHTLSVEVKANVEFDVTSQADWITYVETKALKASTITLSIQANEGYDNRTGTVLVKQKNGDLTGTITITQKQTDYLTVAPTSFELTNEAQSITIDVTDNVKYSVVIPDDAKGWITLQSDTQTKALVDDKVVLTIAQNTTYDDREASVTIKQVDGSLAGTVAIKQAYGEGLIVEKTEYVITNVSQTLSVNVKANIDFNVSSEVDWISLIETKALTESNVSLSVEKNDGYDRTGKVKVYSGSLTVEISVLQKGATIEFEDSVFKAYCVEHFDNDGDGEVSWTEADSANEISVVGTTITSLVGIKHFRNIQTLNCTSTKIKSLDVSGCSKLEVLSCQNGKLTNLIVSGCSALRVIQGAYNDLTSIDLSQCSALQYIDFLANSIASINVNGCSSLETFGLRGNKLTSLDLTGCSALKYLDCGFNNLTSLIIGECPELVSIICYNNQLSILDVSKYPLLEAIECYNNQFTTLDVSNNLELDTLLCFNCPALVEIWLRTGQIIKDFRYDSSVSTIKYKD